MAIAFGRALGTAVLNTSGTTLVITTSATATVGEWIIVRVAADNLSATTPTFTCADSASNTYTVDRQDARVATAAAGIAGAVISAPVTTQLTSGGTITITLSGAVFAKAAVAEAYTGVGGRRASGTNSGGGANTTPTITLTTPVSGDLVIGHVARESRTDPSAYDTDTTDGSWTTGATLNSAAGGTDNQRVQVIYQHKIVTGTGSQTYNVTVTSSVDWLAFESAYEPSGAADQTLDGSLFTVTPTFTAGRVDFQIPGALFTRPPTFLTGVVVADQTLAGSLFTRAPIFDAGAVTTTDQNLVGVLFSRAPTFGTGSVNLTPAGVTFTRSPVFPVGAVTSSLTVPGVLFSRAPTFGTGAVLPQAVTVSGVLFSRSPTFGTGRADFQITGALFTRPPIFGVGEVRVTQTLTGALFSRPPIFDVGIATQAQILGGVLFSVTPTFPTGVATAGPVTLLGVLLSRSPTFPGGSISLILIGATFTRPPVFGAGVVAPETDMVFALSVGGTSTGNEEGSNLVSTISGGGNVIRIEVG